MANYYTEASFMVHFETKEKETRAAEILQSLENHEEEPCTGELAELAKDMEMTDYDYVGFSSRPETNRDGVMISWWIYADETIDVDRTVTFFHYLVENNLLKPFGFEWANTCSSSRLDAFGGGAVFITKDEDHWASSCSILMDLEKQHGVKD
jgi:hypothetical protein